MKKRHLGVVAVFMWALVVVAIPCAAQIELRFDPPDATVSLGDDFRLAIVLDELQDVRSFEIRLRYDPDILTFVDGQPGSGFQDSGCQLFEGAEEDTLGTLYGYVVVLGASCWMTGPGELYGWNFSGSVEGVSQIVVEDVALFAPQMGELENVTLPGTTVTVRGLNEPPMVTDIPDQTVVEGDPFVAIELDGYVSDLESPDTEISWTATGNTDLLVDITDRVATITVPFENWNGSETITFTATDPEGGQGGDSATFTVTAGEVPAIPSAPVFEANPACQGEENLLSWDPVAEADYYVVYLDGTPLSDQISAGTSYMIISTPGDFAVLAGNVFGESEVGPGSTLAIQPLPVSPNAPLVTPNPYPPGTVELAVSWDAVADALEYIIQIDGVDSTTTTQTSGLIPAAPGEITIVAVGECGNSQPSPITTVSEEQPSTADFQVSKSVDVANPGEGDPVVYTVTLTNGGPSDGTGIQLTDVLPEGVTYASHTADLGTYEVGEGLWSVGPLAYDEVATLAIVATVDGGTAGSTIVNTVAVTASDQLDPETDKKSASAEVMVRFPTDAPEVLPAIFSLGNCHPNPFNPSTTIDFSIAVQAAVNLSIFSVDGRLVAVLVNEVLPSGQFTATWDGRDSSGRIVASGMYIYSLSAGDFFSTKSMVLVK